MSRFYTYSFEDTSVVVSHPNFGQYSAYGTGIGNVSVGMAQEVSSIETGADLATVISKHAYVNGTVTFNILQSSEFNTWMNKLSMYLENADVSEFALATIYIRNKSTGETFNCSGCVHQKRPDSSFQDKAQTKSWTMICANIAVS